MLFEVIVVNNAISHDIFVLNKDLKISIDDEINFNV
jgi:hypothetical protein